MNSIKSKANQEALVLFMGDDAVDPAKPTIKEIVDRFVKIDADASKFYVIDNVKEDNSDVNIRSLSGKDLNQLAMQFMKTPEAASVTNYILQLQGEGNWGVFGRDYLEVVNIDMSLWNNNEGIIEVEFRSFDPKRKLNANYILGLASFNNLFEMDASDNPVRICGTSVTAWVPNGRNTISEDISLGKPGSELYITSHTSTQHGRSRSTLIATFQGNSFWANDYKGVDILKVTFPFMGNLYSLSIRGRFSRTVDFYQLIAIGARKRKES